MGSDPPSHETVPSTGDLALATVMFTDAVGFTGRTQIDEAGTIQQMRADLALIRQRVEADAGRVIKETGDGLLAVFSSAQRAVGCAIALQTDFSKRSAGSSEPLTHRISLHLGEIETVAGDIYGDAVNVCSRLLEHAKPHGVVMSEAVHSLVKPRLPMAARSLGRLKLKSVADKIPAYHLWFRTAAVRREEIVSLSPSPESGLPSGDWYCPPCGYNLRGRIGSGCCPECGWEFDAQLRTVSLLPWTYRKQIGGVKALFRTAWIATRHPSLLAAELHRPITFNDASAFHRTVSIAVLLAFILSMGVTFAGEFIRHGHAIGAGPSGAGPGVSVLLAGVFVVAGFMTALLMMGVNAVLLIFRASDLPADSQNRLAAVGRYTIGPLFWLVIVLPAAALFTAFVRNSYVEIVLLLAVLPLHAYCAYRVRTRAHPPSRTRRILLATSVIVGWLIPVLLVVGLTVVMVQIGNKFKPLKAIRPSTRAVEGGRTTQLGVR